MPTTTNAPAPTYVIINALGQFLVRARRSRSMSQVNTTWARQEAEAATFASSRQAYAVMRHIDGTGHLGLSVHRLSTVLGETTTSTPAGAVRPARASAAMPTLTSLASAERALAHVPRIAYRDWTIEKVGREYVAECGPLSFRAKLVAELKARIDRECYATAV